MNYTGKDMIDAIVRRLQDEDIKCYDSQIVAILASLNKYELSQLTTFGEVDSWLSERNNEAKVNNLNQT
jgi:hypothetical protein